MDQHTKEDPPNYKFPSFKQGKPIESSSKSFELEIPSFRDLHPLQESIIPQEKPYQKCILPQETQQDLYNHPFYPSTFSFAKMGPLSTKIVGFVNNKRIFWGKNKKSLFLLVYLHMRWKRKIRLAKRD